MRIGVEMVDARGIEGCGAALYAMDFIALVQEQFREVRAILARDPSYQSNVFQ
jgi:hypothetical protein